QGVLVDEDQAERAAQERQHLQRGDLQRLVGVAREQRGDQRRVGGVAPGQLSRRGPAVARRDQLAQFVRIREVAVVGQGDGAAGGVAQGRLGVLPGRTARGAVAAV